MIEKVKNFFVCLKTIGFEYAMKVTFATLRQIFQNLVRPRRINNKNTYKQYVDYLDELKKNRSNILGRDTDAYVRTDKSPKLIAWYTPQYYGNISGEWNAIFQNTPGFTGHYQPHIPYDMKSYDLENIEVLRWQVRLAKQYGIFGFAFEWNEYHKKNGLLQKLLMSSDIDMQYCLRWIIDFQGEDTKQKIQELLPFLNDERYIKIEGRPVLIISGCDIEKKVEVLEIIKVLRNAIKQAGFPEAYLMMTNEGYAGDVVPWNMDALVEYPPEYIFSQCDRYPYSGYIATGFEPDLYDVNLYIKDQKYLQQYNHEYYRSVLVGFDDSTCQKSVRCKIIMNNTPEKFKSWLKTVLTESNSIHNQENNFVFINSWNEWEKGCHLEPDKKTGYAYLRALRESLEEFEKGPNTNAVSDRIINNRKNGIKKNKYYVQCIESMGDIVACEPIARYLKKIDENGEVYWIVKEQYKGLIEYNPYVESVIGIGNMVEALTICNELRKDTSNIIIDCHYDGYTSFKMTSPHVNPNNPQVNGKTYLHYGGLLQSFALAAGLPAIEDAPIFWEREEGAKMTSLPERYVVFHCQSALKIKDWSSLKWNVLAERLIQEGYNIVEIGLERTVNANSTQYYDCTKIRDFQEIANIIKRAACFVGVDSGFAHIANCFKIHGVLIFGRYKNFRQPMVYTGAYKDKNVAEIIYAHSGIAREVEIEKVYSSVKRWLK